MWSLSDGELDRLQSLAEAGIVDVDSRRLLELVRRVRAAEAEPELTRLVGDESSTPDTPEERGSTTAPIERLFMQLDGGKQGGIWVEPNASWVYRGTRSLTDYVRVSYFGPGGHEGEIYLLADDAVRLAGMLVRSAARVEVPGS